MKILLTGASGMLGTEITNQLINEPNVELYAFTSRIDSIKTTGDNLFLHRNEDLEKIVKEKSINCIIHCSFSRSMLVDDLEDSLFFGENVLKTAVKYNVQQVINVSSRSIYGQNKNIPWNEMSNVDLNTPYATAKYKSEEIGKKFNCEKTRVFSLRLAGLLSEEFSQRLPNKMIKYGLKNRKLRVVGGEQQFSYLDIKDAANGIIKFAFSNKEYGQIFNFGPEKYFTILEMSKMIACTLSEMMKIDIEVEHVKSEIQLYDNMDSNRFYDVTQWHPQIELKDTIKRIANYIYEEEQ